MSGRDTTDGELLRALRREPEAVGVLYDRYALRLVRYLQQHGATEDVAVDATQEMFARLIVRGRRVRQSSEGTIWPWLAVSGRNLLRDWQRRGAVEAKARQRLGLPTSADDEALTAVPSTRSARQRDPAWQRERSDDAIREAA